MSLARRCLESVASHAREHVGDCGPPDGSALQVPGMQMELYADDVTAGPFGEGRSVSVVLGARALGAEDAGIRVLAVGLGETDEAAAVDAGHQWSSGVLPALLSYLYPERSVADVKRLPMIVGTADSEERFGWTAHVGPVVSRLLGPPGAPDIDRGDLTPGAAYRAIFEALHPYAAHRQMMWSEAFAVRYPGGRVDATARLQNHEWPEGRAALLAWAASWPDTGSFILSKRQFVLFEPTPIEELRSSTELVARLEREIADGRGSE